MHVPTLLLGAASLVLAAIHVLWGGKDVAQPMLRARFDATARETMFVCWHAFLLAGGIRGARDRAPW